MRVANNIYELIGETPIVKLNRVVDEDSADVYLKLEWFNPGKSIKDRIALSMIESAENEGLLKPGGTIVEPTSGNTGIGLAMVGAAKGYKVILTMPETMSIERRKLLKAYGAEIIITPGVDGMSGAIKKAQELIEENPDYYMPQQFNNPANPEIHRKTTAQEILKQMGNELDVFIAGVGTGGTLTGIGEILKKNIPTIKVVAVEPATSAVLSGEDRGPHKIQGIGAGFVPEVLNTEVYDEIEKVSDEEAFAAARRVAKEEGIFVGISCGAAIAAAIRQAKKLGKGKKVLAISPDTGLKYLSSGLVED